MYRTKLRQWIGRLGGKTKQSYPDYRLAHFGQRLQIVQESLACCLDAAPNGSINILSLCAGDGADVLGVLKCHPRRSDVCAYLIELNRATIDAGNRQVIQSGLQHQVHFVGDDATDYQTYKRIPLANIVLLCGVWGHVPKPQRSRLASALSALCKPSGAIIWTRGIAKGTQRLREIQALFAPSDWFDCGVRFTADENWAAATYRFCGRPSALPEHGRIFNFRGGVGAQ